MSRPCTVRRQKRLNFRRSEKCNKKLGLRKKYNTIKLHDTYCVHRNLPDKLKERRCSHARKHHSARHGFQPSFCRRWWKQNKCSILPTNSDAGWTTSGIHFPNITSAPRKPRLPLPRARTKMRRPIHFPRFPHDRFSTVRVLAAS